MADPPDTPPRQMSLIPYAHPYGEVVLYVCPRFISPAFTYNRPRRHGNAEVVFDPRSRQLSVRDDSDDPICLYCGRPFNEDWNRNSESSEHHERPNSGRHDRPMVNPEYFGMLARSQRASPNSSAGPSTPVGRFFQPALRSGRSRDVSGTQQPPSDAEFVTSEPSAAAREGISSSAFSPGYFKQFFRSLYELGRGGNGVVLLVEHIMDRVSLGQFACKRVPVGNDHNWLEKVLVEVKLLQKIPHNNLVAYHWVWLEDYQPSKFGPSIPCLWILQEYCNGGDLHSYVLGPNKPAPDSDNTMKEKLKERARRRSKGVDTDELPTTADLRGPSRLTFEEIFSFFRDITSGLHHLHTKGYIHRDLKPSNCLIQLGGTRPRVLISDFGEVQAAGAKRGSTGATGTISYCAPEVLQRDATGEAFGDFTTKSDIFSLGMIVYFMCFGRLPYRSADGIDEEDEDLEELRSEITKWPGFDEEVRQRPDLPERLYRYLKRLLSVDPNERPSTDEILSSIKAGAGLGETVTAAFVEENSSRVSAIDSPRQRGSPQGRTAKGTQQPPYSTRPALSSTLARQFSDPDATRPDSPMRRQSSQNTPTTPTEHSVIRRPRHVDLPPPSPTSKSPQLSPRLMLPPPQHPPSILTQLYHISHHPMTITLLRTTLFLIKVFSLTVPCTPFTTSAWVLYPLLGIAALDLGIMEWDFRRSVLLFVAHVVVVFVAEQNGRLCERGPGEWVWNERGETWI